MSNKTYGLKKEREVMKMLYEDKDTYYVQRSRGSFGAFDVVAFTKDYVKLVSVKSTKKKYASFRKEIEHLYNVPVPSYCKKYLYIYWSPRKDRKYKGWQIIKISEGD